MSDKQFDIFALIVAIALFVWYYWTKHNGAQAAETPGQISGAFPQNVNWPMTSVPASSYAPPTIGQISLNIKNPALSSLSNQYIPLFGMVGMAQGTYYA